MKYFMSKKLCLSDRILPGGILVKHGKIQDIILQDYEDYITKYKTEDIEVIDFGDNVLMSGVVDSHVHVNEPGRTEWEGFESATKAAAAGGVTTIVDMPLNSIPPTTTVEYLKIKQQSARGKLFVDVAFWGGLIPGNSDHLKSLVDEGVVGFKCFMSPSGVDEFPNVQMDNISDAIGILNNSGAVLAFHAEIDEHIDISGLSSTKYSTFLKSRPADMELRAIESIIKLCSKHNVKCHIVHLSTAYAFPMIQKAKQNGVKLTIETCPHYLALNSECIPDKATQFKCCPPIRESANKERLWQGIKNGLIDQVVSDHSPCTADLKLLKEGNFLKAWGGISSLQFGLSIFWTEARKRNINIWEISKYMSYNPARLCGLHKRKGALKPGLDADFIIWDPDVEFQITPDIIFHKNKVTPYMGKNLYGKVLETFIRGNSVFKYGNHSKPIGDILKKNQ